LRRGASDLAGWPEVNRIVHWVELDCEVQHLYKLAWKEFKKALEGVGTLSKQQAALVKSEAVIRLRQKSSPLKVEDSIELCLELLDNGRQVAISCEFLATMDAMEEVLPKEKISYARVDGRCFFGIFFVPDMPEAVRELWRFVRPAENLPLRLGDQTFLSLPMARSGGPYRNCTGVAQGIQSILYRGCRRCCRCYRNRSACRCCLPMHHAAAA
jgi:hypothetical protein